MKQTRKEFLKNICAIGICAPIIPTLGSTTAHATMGEPEIVWPKEPYKQAEFLIRQVSALEEKSRGRFNPHKDSFYIALPKSCIDEMSASLNRYGWHAMGFCHREWPFGVITDTHDILGVWNGKEWVDDYFDESFGVKEGIVLNCTTYCDSSHGEDSFVRFSI